MIPLEDDDDEDDEDKDDEDDDDEDDDDDYEDWLAWPPDQDSPASIYQEGISILSLCTSELHEF